MKNILLTTLIVIAVSSFKISAQEIDCFKRTGSGGSVNANVLVEYDSSSLLFAGRYNTKFYTDSITYPGWKSGDTYLMKINKDGTTEWVQTFGSLLDEAGGKDISVDTDGNILLAGNTSEDLNFPDTVLVAGGGIRPYLAKFNPQGKVIWATHYKPASGYQWANCVITDKENNVYMSGGGNGGDYIFDSVTHPANGGGDAYILKLDQNGKYLWSKSFGGEKRDDITCMEITPDHQIIVAGFVQGNAYIDTHFISTDTATLFIAWYDMDGNLKKLKYAKSKSRSMPTSMTLNKYGEIVITGEYYDTLAFGKKQVVGVDQNDLFVMKLDKYGDPIWMITGGGGKDNEGRDDNSPKVACDKKGNIFLMANVATDNISLAGTVISRPYARLMSAKINPEGKIIYLHNIKHKGFIVGNNHVLVPQDNGTVLAALNIYNSCLQNISSDCNTGFDDSIISQSAYIALLTDTTFVPDNFNNSIAGRVFNDADSNCIMDDEDTGLHEFLIKAEPGPYYTLTDENGFYLMNLPDGNYTLSLIIPESEALTATYSCPASGQKTGIILSGGTKTEDLDFAVKAETCHQLSVDLTMNRKRRCFRNYNSIQYVNDGYQSVDNVEILVQFPGYTHLLSASKNYTIDSDGTYRFSIGTLESHTGGILGIVDSVACINDIQGVTQCVSAWILPENNCETIDPTWDKSSIVVEGYCQNDTVYFVIKNAGDGDMSGASEYRIYFDDVLGSQENFKLNSGESMRLKVAPIAERVRLEADQHPEHPGRSRPRETIELCGVQNNNLSGLVTTSVINDDLDQDITIHCERIRDSYDPNDKLVYPSGVTQNNYIPEDIEKLEYKIRFQNTGTDTAYKVLIIDTLSPLLDISTFSVVASSHEYKTELIDVGKNAFKVYFNNIMLPDSNVDEPNSHGFFQFSIQPVKGLPDMTAISNFADIYFDYNEAVRTPVVTNILHDYVETDLSLNDNVTVLKESSKIEEVFEKYIVISPNPAREILKIQHPENNINVLCRNVQGQIINLPTEQGENFTNIDVSSYNGLLFVTINTENGSLTRKIVVE